MFNMMNWIKLAGATIASLLVFLLGSWAANTIYSTGTGAEVAHAPATAPAATAPAATAPAAAAPAAVVAATAPAAAAAAFEPPALSAPVADQIAAADLAAGEKVWLKCKACHRLDGKNGVGPALNGIFGRVTGSVEGFKYSDANKNAHVTWTPEVMNDYLSNPKTYMPGNKMTFVGLPLEADRINVIAWLMANGGAADGAVPAAAAPTAEPAASAPAAEAAAAAPALVPIESADGATLVARLASADVAAGGAIFEQCAACHKLDGTNSVGPYLNGVLGRATAQAEGYAYSEANKAANQTWTASTIYRYLVDPQSVLPGTAMTFAGLPNDQDRINVIAWLLSNGGVAEKDLQSAQDALALGAAQAAAAATVPAVAEVPAPTAAAPAATEAVAAPAAAAGGEAPIAERLATADLEAGSKVFAKCKACHKLDGKNAVGPHLDGLFGRVSGAVEGYKYSDANKAAGVTWTVEVLDAYLADPKAYMPGNKMTFVGLPKPEDRANVIAWLQANGG
ncbi:MAG: cytochrome c family protein [Phaeovulum sp.]|uniref:c-type cytochrome n=2 Tax=Phaeovulum sp. TaxID=2934796 RepID=UPI0027321305|nr:cytochrome c family protein [Phaeovulum sp.]MDP2061686.1 cytochrome c family protein [Phaeovulum sp.]